LGVRRQPEASPPPQRKPRFEVKGHPEFYKYLEKLRNSKRSEDQQLARQIDDAIAILEERPTAGEAIPRDRWPDKYRSLPSLFRYRLSRIHRMIYSIIKPGAEPVCVLIIEAMDHTEYNRVFGYN